MRDLWYLVRFFHVVPPVPPMMTSTFVVLTLASTIAIVGDPAVASGALVPVLLLQSFAASSGFALPARRGHYDLLFTRGSSRTSIALVHWATSITPGLGSWLVLAVLEILMSAGASDRLLASGTCAAVFLVSTIPWAIGVALPRFSGGIGWLLVAVTATTTFSSGVMGEWTASSTRIEELAWPAWAFFVYPIGAVGTTPRASPDDGRCSVRRTGCLRDGDGTSVGRQSGRAARGGAVTLAVSVRNLAMQYGRRLVFQELSFDLVAGQAAGVVGPNGSGKTTLLRAIAGCLTPRSGEIRINGLTPRDALARTGVGYFAGEATLPGSVRARHWGSLGAGDDVTRESRRLRTLSRGTRQLLGLRTVLGRHPLGRHPSR